MVVAAADIADAVFVFVEHRQPLSAVSAEGMVDAAAVTLLTAEHTGAVFNGVYPDAAAQAEAAFKLVLFLAVSAQEKRAVVAGLVPIVVLMEDHTADTAAAVLTKAVRIQLQKAHGLDAMVAEDVPVTVLVGGAAAEKADAVLIGAVQILHF